MKILLRNLVNLFARNKTAALLNIAGLTVAFASFMLIMMQVWYELGYDRCYPNANRIYGLCFQVPQSGDLGTVLPRPLAEKLLRSSAGIETADAYRINTEIPTFRSFGPNEGRSRLSPPVFRSFRDPGWMSSDSKRFPAT